MDPRRLCTPVWIYDTLNYCIHWANDSALSLWEADSEDELYARDFRDDMSEAIANQLRAYLDEFEGGATLVRQWQLSPRGIDKRVLCRFSGIRLDTGRMAMLCEALPVDLLDEEGLGGSVMVSLFDRNGRYLSANPPFLSVYGKDALDLEVVLGEHTKRLLRQVDEKGQICLDLKLPTPLGPAWYYLELRRIASGHRRGCLVASQMDITERKARELEQHRQARRDVLTGLANRLAFQEHVDERVREDAPFSVLYLDLDGFKLINDSFGHAVGDALLKEVARRLNECAGDDALVSRLGGDEFTVVRVADGDLELARSLVDRLCEPFRIADFGRLSVSASVGLATHPEHGGEAGDLVAHADTAMYEAKRRGRKAVVRYEPHMSNSVRRRALLTQALHETVAGGAAAGVGIAFQPIFTPEQPPGSRSCWALEALLRFHTPKLGDVAPPEVIHAAEDGGLIAELEQCIWRVAIRDFNALRARGLAPARLSMNVSAQHLAHPEFVQRLCSAVRGGGLTESEVILELTETAMMRQVETSVAPMEAVSKAGFLTAIDDFGTGYSSLAYLHELPVDIIKVDRSFVRRIEQDASVVRFIAGLAAAQGRQVVAEGVETHAQRAALLDIGVELLQGYLFARPRRAEEL